MSLNCPKCDEINKDTIYVDDYNLCEDCMKECDDFIDPLRNRMRYRLGVEDEN